MPLDIKRWMRDELERRKDLYRRLFAGEPLRGEIFFSASASGYGR